MPFPAGCIDTDSAQAPAIDRCLADSQVLGKFAAAGLSLLQQNSQTFSCWRKKTMKNWVFLALAIMGDVVAPCALKSANGFTRLVPSLAVLVGYSDAFHVLSRARLCENSRSALTSANLDCFLPSVAKSECLDWTSAHCSECDSREQRK